MFNRKPSRTVVVDGQPIECSEDAACAIKRLQRQVADAEAVSQRLRADQVAIVEVRDSEIAALKADNERLQASQMKPEEIDRLVDERVQRMADSSVVSPQNDSDSGKLYVSHDGKKRSSDPVVIALYDRPEPRAIHDNGYGASVTALDYRTNIKREDR